MSGTPASSRPGGSLAIVLAGVTVLGLLGLLALSWGGGSGTVTTGGSMASASGAAVAPVGPGVSTRAGSGSGSGVRTAQVDQALLAKARAVLATLDSTGQPPRGYEGGRQFLNDGRGGTTALPRSGTGGRPLTYREYDVNPYHPGVNRGPQRLVVGSDGSAYGTGDHYVTWSKLR